VAVLRHDLSVKGSAISVLCDVLSTIPTSTLIVNLGLRGGRAKHDLNVREVWNHIMYKYILHLCLRGGRAEHDLNV